MILSSLPPSRIFRIKARILCNSPSMLPNFMKKMSSTSANGTERPKTADLMDLEPSDAQIANDIFKNYGGSKRFFGQIETVRCFENNPLVRQTLSTPGMGRVLVVDGGGSLRYALMGDQLGALACENDWQGVIINGCVRDSEELSQMAVGVKALGTHPQKSKKDIPGEKGIPVCFAGVRFIPGQWLYADLDGIIVAKEQIHTGLASKM
mmetsp:Transcript_15979/g.20472  ORF Transcript_15979/g.20472 Transcript_15979/m.20472 type:complete len:208 (+) Transcript_15979:64-687(+)